MQFNIQDISKYRSALMGIAMLLVVWHHLPMGVPSIIVNTLKGHAGWGVDIFLFLSGIGLYCSAHKKFTLKSYYIKRFIRIFPVYAFIILCTDIITGHFNLSAFFYKVTTIGFWIGKNSFEWFIPTIVGLYLIFPIFYYIIKYNKGILFATILTIAIYIYISLLPEHSNFQLYFRIPVFLCGVVCGYLLTQDLSNKQYLEIKILFAILLLIGLIMCGYSLHKYYNPSLPITDFRYNDMKVNGWLFRPYFFITPGACLLIASILKYMHRTIIDFLSLIGKMSMEVYLLHLLFISLARYLTDTYNLSKPIFGGLLVIFSFILSYYVHKGNIIVMNVLKKKLL